jgi:hypothetical protein
MYTHIREVIFGLRVQNNAAFLVSFVKSNFALPAFTVTSIDSLNTLSCLLYADSQILGLKTCLICPSILKLKSRVRGLFNWPSF